MVLHASIAHLEIGSNCLFTFLAPVSEQVLVARDTERLVVSQYVTMSRQIQRTVEARQHADALYRHVHH